VHDSRGIEIVNFTISLALSAGTLVASAGTPYRLVPVHFYPCVSHKAGGRLPLLSTMPAVTLATLRRSGTSFAAR